SRSQSDSGAIAASSLRRSSESTLELQQPPLVGDPVRAVGAEAVCAYDAVTGDEEAEPVAGAEGAGRPGGSGRPGERGQLAVRDDLAARDLPQRGRTAAEERRLVLEVDLDVSERDGLAGEVGAQQGHELVLAKRAVRLPPRERQLVPDDPTVVE